jgi:hypothetical protein
VCVCLCVCMCPGLGLRDLNAVFTTMKHDLISVAGFAKAEVPVRSN